MNKKSAYPSHALVPRIEGRIVVLREHRVVIDADLAVLYGVPTKALNQAVKRNIERFPADFMFQLSQNEKSEVVTACDHLQNLKFSKSLPFAFTEHGAIQAANVLSSSHATEMGIFVVRAFVRLKQASSQHKDLAARLQELELKTESLSARHDSLSRDARAQLKEVFDALRALMVQPQSPRRSIGFITPDEKVDPRKDR